VSALRPSWEINLQANADTDGSVDVIGCYQ
jgi:hypothetical protein